MTDEKKKIRKGRTHSGKSISAEEFMDFDKQNEYNKKYHNELRWVFAGEKYSNGTVSGKLYFASVTVKTSTGEICDISVGAHPEGTLPGVGDYYRIISRPNSSHCSEEKESDYIENSIANIQLQLKERAEKLSAEKIFYAFDLEKGGKNEHLFFEHQKDRNEIYKMEEFKSYRNNKFY